MSKPINVKPEDKVRYLGLGYARSYSCESLDFGDMGTVVKVTVPLTEPNGKSDATDGYAQVKWPEWTELRVIWPDQEGKRWEKVEEA